MGKYGRAAEIAAQLLATQNTMTPMQAWDKAVSCVFPESRSSQAKGCPRASFLALCEMGAVKNVAAGNYTHSIDNRGYVERALEALRHNPALDEKSLWQIATNGVEKTHNQQMDVVTTLYRKRFVH